MSKKYKILENLILKIFQEQEYDWWQRHAKRTAFIAGMFAPFLKINPDLAYLAGLSHDVGKTAKPVKRVLISARGRSLTSKEWKVVKTHPLLGVKILKEIEKKEKVNFPKMIILATKYHQIWYDEKRGYPLDRGYKQLSLKEKRFISLVSFADAIDAMLCQVFIDDATRIYDMGRRSFKEVKKEIYKKAKGKQLHPQLVNLLKRFIPKIKKIYQEV